MWFYCMSLIEPSLTANNLLSALSQVKDWSVSGLPRVLRIPRSKVVEMEQLYPDLSQRQLPLIQFWLDSHPAPSWERVCWALYGVGEYKLIENLQNKYFKGSYWVNIQYQIGIVLYNNLIALRFFVQYIVLIIPGIQWRYKNLSPIYIMFVC